MNEMTRAARILAALERYEANLEKKRKWTGKRKSGNLLSLLLPPSLFSGSVQEPGQGVEHQAPGLTSHRTKKTTRGGATPTACRPLSHPHYLERFHKKGITNKKGGHHGSFSAGG